MRHFVLKPNLSSTSSRAFLAAIVCMGVFAAAFIQDHAASSQEADGPLMRVSEKIHQFGEVNPWEMMEHTFTIFNNGQGVLRIQRVGPD